MTTFQIAGCACEVVTVRTSAGVLFKGSARTADGRVYECVHKTAGEARADLQQWAATYGRTAPAA